MSQIARANVEILVHTTAPSRGRDDARYRALADAYLNFVPVTRQRVEVAAIEAADIDEQASFQLQEELAESQEERQSQASYRPTEEELAFESQGPIRPLHPDDLELIAASQLIASPDLSFSGAIDNADSPSYRQRITCRLPERPSSQESPSQSPVRLWKRPESTVPDSQPEDPSPAVESESASQTLDRYVEALRALRESSEQLEAIRSEGQVEVVEANGSTVQVRNSQAELSSATKRLVAEISSSIDITSSPSPNKSSLKIIETSFQHFEVIPATQDPSMEDLANSRYDESLDDLRVPSTAPPTITETPLPVDHRPLKRRKTEELQVDNSIVLETPDITTEDASSNPHEDSTDINPLLLSSPLAVQLTSSPPQPTLPTAGPSNREQIEHPSSDPVVPPILPSSSQPSTLRNGKPLRLDWSNTLEIHNSGPKVSSKQHTPEEFMALFLVPKLQWYVNNELLLKQYKPFSQSRELRSMERGWWSLDCSSWDAELRAKFWNNIGSLIGNDMLGWGLWAERTEDHVGVRVFCWDNMVVHVYLMIFVASCNKVRRAKACWVDAEQNVVIRMQDPDEG